MWTYLDTLGTTKCNMQVLFVLGMQARARESDLVALVRAGASANTVAEVAHVLCFLFRLPSADGSCM